MSVLSQACANLFATRSTRATVGTQTTQVMTDKISEILKPKAKGERCQVQQVQTQTLPGATLCQEGLPNGFLCVPRTFCFHPDLNLAKCCPVSCSTGFLGHSMVVLCRLMGIWMVIRWSLDPGDHWAALPAGALAGTATPSGAQLRLSAVLAQWRKLHADVERFVVFCSSSYCKEEIDRQDSE